jgi:uncharacterized glyoxalase superfamily protein PhnB
MHVHQEDGLFDCRPILCVQSVARSIDYFVRQLGFHLGWAWVDEPGEFLQPGDRREPTFALVGRGRVQFMLSQQSQGVPGVWLHLDVQTAQQVDAMYQEWTGRGARILEPPSVRLWGMYEMRVQDLDGNTFRVSSPPHPTGSG